MLHVFQQNLANGTENATTLASNYLWKNTANFTPSFQQTIFYLDQGCEYGKDFPIKASEKILAIVCKTCDVETSFYIQTARFNCKIPYLNVTVQETQTNVQIFKLVSYEEYLSNNIFSLTHSLLLICYNTETN